MDEPIADAVRGILDGHIVLSRSIAERGRFPSIDVLRSVSRSLPKCHDDTENGWLRTARQYMSTYHDMEDLIRIGAYKKGSNPEVDKAIVYQAKLETFLSQGIMETISLEDSFTLLQEALEG
jgi:flagellum-specific ATP synthase